jgi:2-dehydropantoate 2-reductase
VKVAIIGAGAIGALAAGYLADKGEEVILVARPEQAAAISQDGLTIEGARGKITVKLDARNKLDEKAGLVILATKTQDLEKAVTENLEYLKDSPVLTVQNGVRAEDLIAQKLGKDNLFASIVMFGATYLAPGRIVHNFEGNWILGCPHSGTKENLEKIASLTSKIFPSPLSENIMGMKWLKLFLNANNCLPAIVGKSMQEAFANISVCKISLEIWKEGWALLNKARIQLASLPDFPLERIKGLIFMPPDEAAKIFSGIMTGLSKEPLYGSILQSIKRNRPSEIDYINGEFLRVAESLKQDAPLNKRLVRMVSDVEKNKQFFSEQELISQTAEVLN